MLVSESVILLPPKKQVLKPTTKTSICIIGKYDTGSSGFEWMFSSTNFKIACLIASQFGNQDMRPVLETKL